MARLLFDWTDSQGVETTLSFVDAIISDTKTSTLDVTSYPVEEGSPITDNVRPTPQTLAFEVNVSSLPLSIEGASKRTLTLNVPKPKGLSPSRLIDAGNGAVASLVGLPSGGSQASSVETYTPPPGRDFVAEMIDILDVIQGRGTDAEPPALLRVTSTKKAYTGSYVLSNCTVRRSKDEGGGASISMELTEIFFAVVKTVPTPKPTALRANAKKSKGTKDTKTPAPNKASIAKKLVDTFAPNLLK